MSVSNPTCVATPASSPITAARSEAERLAGLTSNCYLAILWLAVGDHAKAEHQALATYRWAWADGEP